MALDTAFEVEPPSDSKNGEAFEVESPLGGARGRPRLACARWAASLTVLGTMGIGTLLYIAGKPLGHSTDTAPQTVPPAVQSVPAVAAAGDDPEFKPPMDPVRVETLWDTGKWKMLGPNETPYTHQYEMKEKRNIIGMIRSYKFELEQYEDPKTGQELHDNIDVKVMKIEPHFFTMHARASVYMGQPENFMEETVTGDGLEGLQLHMPKVFNLHYTWRVSHGNTILFTIQKQLFSTHCKYFNLFKCKQVLKIYVGHKGDKSTLIYYGVGDHDLEEPDFKFYHSETDYLANKKKWVAKIDHKKHDSGDNEDKYKIKVKPGEDSSLLLLAAYCLDQIADDNREPDEEHDDH